MRRFSVPVRRFSFSPRPLKAIAEGASKGSLLRRASEYEALRVRLYGSSLADRNVARVDCLAGVWVYRRLLWPLWPLWPSIGTASTLAGFSDVDRRCDDIAQSPHKGKPLTVWRASWLAASLRLAVLVQRNAMNMRMWEELVDVWPTVDLDSSVRCVILAGEGPAWCSGMDLAVFAEVCHH